MTESGLLSRLVGLKKTEGLVAGGRDYRSYGWHTLSSLGKGSLEETVDNGSRKTVPESFSCFTAQ